MSTYLNTQITSTDHRSTIDSTAIRNKVDPSLIIAPVVTEVAEQQWQEIAQLVEQWQQMCIQKCVSTGKQSQSGKPLGRSWEICIEVTRQIKTTFRENNRWDTILVCRDIDQKIQAIALHHKKNNYLDYILTHPDNIDHPANQNLPRVKGAGTQIILYLARETLRSNSVLKLQAARESTKFFKKLHFEEDIEKKSPYMGTPIPMKLTAERIKDLATNFTPPFNQLIIGQ